MVLIAIIVIIVLKCIFSSKKYTTMEVQNFQSKNDYEIERENSIIRKRLDMYHLGDKYYNGNEVHQDYAEAFKCYISTMNEKI